MYTEKSKGNKTVSATQLDHQKPSNDTPTFQFKDMRPETIAQRGLQEIANNTTSKKPIQKQKNNTGLPDNLKTGIENLSGYSMDDVKVHRNSAKPAQLQAHAYAQGTDIHLAPGQDKHLPHEAWHVVQQKQGRVKPTLQMKGKGKVNVNDDAGLEKEADFMGGKALSKFGGMISSVEHQPENISTTVQKTSSDLITQRTVNLNGQTNPNTIWAEVGSLVSTRYRRKQLLFTWAADSHDRDYTSPQELADDLDLQNRKGGRLGRVRPVWAPNLTSIFSQTFGGSWHRRHIIMSSLMRYAVYAVTDMNTDHEDTVIEKYNHLTAGLTPKASDLAQAEANLVYILHNNPANLVIDEGSWNSAIGSYAHNIETLLKKPKDQVYELYCQDANAFLNQFVKGFQPNLQKTINAFWREYFENNPFNSAEELYDTLEMMYDNAAVDLMSTQQMPQQENLTASLLALHGGFASITSSGNLNNLMNVCKNYISLGNNPGAYVGGKVVRYKNIL